MLRVLGIYLSYWYHNIIITNAIPYASSLLPSPLQSGSVPSRDHPARYMPVIFCISPTQWAQYGVMVRVTSWFLGDIFSPVVVSLSQDSRCRIWLLLGSIFYARFLLATVLITVWSFWHEAIASHIMGTSFASRCLWFWHRFDCVVPVNVYVGLYDSLAYRRQDLRLTFGGGIIPILSLLLLPSLSDTDNRSFISDNDWQLSSPLYTCIYRGECRDWREMRLRTEEQGISDPGTRGARRYSYWWLGPSPPDCTPCYIATMSRINTEYRRCPQSLGALFRAKDLQHAACEKAKFANALTRDHELFGGTAGHGGSIVISTFGLSHSWHGAGITEMARRSEWSLQVRHPWLGSYGTESWKSRFQKDRNSTLQHIVVSWCNKSLLWFFLGVPFSKHCRRWKGFYPRGRISKTLVGFSGDFDAGCLPR